MNGKLVIISAPSGAGKTTIVKHLLDSGLNLSFSISATTRKLRDNERDGVDYFFLTPQEFREKVINDEFVEWEEVYKDLMYGTLKSELDRIWAEGNHVLFDVDVKGGINLKNKFGPRSISVFIKTPSVEDLEHRLLLRGTDNREKINIRIAKATEEMRYADKFDIILVNNHLDKAKEEAVQIVSSFLSR